MSKPIRKKIVKVGKALSPEEATALSNIQAIVSELMQMGGGGTPPAEPTSAPAKPEPPAPKPIPMKTVKEAPIPPAKPDGEQVDEYDDTQEKEVKMIIKSSNIKKILKALETTPSDGATASDDAEERMDDPNSDLSEENIMEVAKALAMLISGKKSVQKSAVSNNNSTLELLLGKIVEVQKSTQNSIDELSTAFGHILKGTGIAEQLKISKAEKEKLNNVSKSSNDELMTVLKSLIGNKEPEAPANLSNKVKVNKSLANYDVLSAMVGR